MTLRAGGGYACPVSSPTSWPQVSLRLSPEVLSEAEALAELLSTPDMQLVRAEVLRLAVRRGLEVLRGEAPKGKPKKRA